MATMSEEQQHDLLLALKSLEEHLPTSDENAAKYHRGQSTTTVVTNGLRLCALGLAGALSESEEGILVTGIRLEIAAKSFKALKVLGDLLGVEDWFDDSKTEAAP